MFSSNLTCAYVTLYRTWYYYMNHKSRLRCRHDTECTRAAALFYFYVIVINIITIIPIGPNNPAHMSPPHTHRCTRSRRLVQCKQSLLFRQNEIFFRNHVLTRTLPVRNIVFSNSNKRANFDFTTVFFFTVEQRIYYFTKTFDRPYEYR